MCLDISAGLLSPFCFGFFWLVEWAGCVGLVAGGGVSTRSARLLLLYQRPFKLLLGLPVRMLVLSPLVAVAVYSPSPCVASCFFWLGPLVGCSLFSYSGGAHRNLFCLVVFFVGH